MPFDEAKEHAPGRLHDIFAVPYAAFGNTNLERCLHLRIALETLLQAPCRQGRLTLRVIYGWENGDHAIEDLRYSDHPLRACENLHNAAVEYHHALHHSLPPAQCEGSLLAGPLEDALADAKAQGQKLDADIRHHPASWPAFEKGLYLYTFFKIYHRLTYGEDEPYRSIYCKSAKGGQEIHEFHIEEGEFAVCMPSDPASPDETLLIMHASQLDPLEAFFGQYLQPSASFSPSALAPSDRTPR
ncbi:hypothetical protein [Pistricoccus aurantiacus]|uniref:hypothetical protein n=1 Tax=Pistricoccus aurantiacus TaxID=1883414 RepID=UPI00363E72C0